MSAAPLSAHGFLPTRGRGYRPEQVDRRLAKLSEERDAAWERAARLTVLAKRIEAEAAELRERVASLTPQTYEALGPRAQQILALSSEESERVRTLAREETGAERAAAETAARQAVKEAREQAAAVRGDAEAYAEQVLRAARSTEEEERSGARRDAEGLRGEALALLKEMRRRTQGVMDAMEKGHGERLAAVEREIAEREGASDTGNTERVLSAQGRLDEAKRALSQAGQQARHGQENAQDTAAELLARAGARSGRIQRDTERLLREHTEASEEVRAHLTHVREGLASLTGRAGTQR